MRLNKALIKSATRHFLLVTIATYEAGAKDWKSLAWGVAAAIVGPAIRAYDKYDPAFGKIADEVTVLLKKAAKKKTK